MFEAAELGRKLSKKEYKALEPELRERLLVAQTSLREADIPLLILLEGADSACKGEVVNLLNQWFDVRGLLVNGFGPKTDEEARRPRFWRYWRNFPCRGQIGVFYGSWYTGELIKRANRKQEKDEFDSHMQRIEQLETLLARDGALILKFWLHTGEDELTARLKKVLAEKEDDWVGAQADRQVLDNYRRFIKAAERAVRLTDQTMSPWHLIEAANHRYRDVTLVRTIIDAVNRRTQEIAGADRQRRKTDKNSAGEVPMPSEAAIKVLDQVDLTLDIDKKSYEARLEKLKHQLNRLSWKAYHRDISMILVFEGWDAAGKGGAIRRIMQSVDARIARVISISAPTDEEKSHHYLWRFWRHIPLAGRHTIYDRSWYGRVLVERVEGFAREEEWRRAYSEINDFEEQIGSRGNVLLKFWLHVDKDEQLARFEARENTPYKNYKITEEDWRNRERWEDYENAVHEMVVKTSTDFAPWTIVPANSKHYARIMVLETICEQLKKALDKADTKRGGK
ncbi:polyphosphate:AMP phosphotransferase [Hahella ganghwensis]|uniref:polyphosphate:AMP phosphotransferase n=1 Tax=Hahella ganghwensis TaxID=286420 RepID=UPI00037F9CB8|nr:polyphosphate:AMP phosphotransferase [Hahella ganghwensis]